MTDQRDPETGHPLSEVDIARARREFIHEQRGWKFLPVVLAFAFVVVLGFLIWGNRTPGPGNTTTTGVDRTVPTAPTTASKTTPAQPDN